MPNGWEGHKRVIVSTSHINRLYSSDFISLTSSEHFKHAKLYIYFSSLYLTKRAMARAGTSSRDWAFSGFVALAHIQKQWGHQRIRSWLSLVEFADWVCYWILGVGGKAVRLSFLTCGFIGSNMSMIQLPANHWVLLYLGFWCPIVAHELLVRDLVLR